ncbi:MAG: hypothetical protein LBU32_26805 [Clostridiales bacterium]|jgi:hypothetical protein|nr:hypothetical protein [Clostridiales bacterium]
MQVVQNWLLKDVLEPAILGLLEDFVQNFVRSLNVLALEIGKSPSDFSPIAVGALNTISEAAIKPIAMVLLTYVFCYEIIGMLIEKNNMAEIDAKNLFVLIFKTAVSIELINNSFKITMAFFDLGKWAVDKALGSLASNEAIRFGNLPETVIASIDGDIGKAVMALVMSLLAWIACWVAVILIYLIAWSRLVMILIFASAAPLPFATMMNREWLGQIGQNYFKNLLAYSLQGVLMVVCLVVYGAVVSTVNNSIENPDSAAPIIASVSAESSEPLADGDAPAVSATNPAYTISLLLVCIFVTVKALMSCLSLAKSIFGAS